MERMELPSIENRIEALTLETEMPSCLPPPPPPVAGGSKYWYSLHGTTSEDQGSVQLERLRYVLNQHERERQETTFSRDCLFCRKHFIGNRSVLFDHLMEQHNFGIGNPCNIVFVNELLDHLEQLLKELRCFFCEKVFKDWGTLKEHMRKKQHKRINPQNKNYDRFYLINYLELGKTWKDLLGEDDGWVQDENDKEMMDWREEDLIFVCLFCPHKVTDFDQMLAHMKESHNFDFEGLKQMHHLDFYKQIKLINYIRKKVYERKCINCERGFNFEEQLTHHLIESGHSSYLPDPSLWDQPLYYFSTFENDNFLCALDAGDGDDEECEVYPEDM